MANADKKPLGELIGSFTGELRKVDAAQAVVRDLEAVAGAEGEKIIKAYGKGPHAILVPGPDGKPVTKLVTFQRVQHQVRWTIMDLAGIPGIVVTQAPPAPPPPPPPAP